MSSRTPLRGSIVAVVGADDIVRAGAAALLAEEDGVAEVVPMSPIEAHRFPRWDGIDTVLIDAVDPGRPFDQVVGVEIIERIRAVAVSAPPRTVAISDDASWRPVRRRMAEAGADLVTTRRSIGDRAVLRTVVLHDHDDENLWRSHPDEVEHRLGITQWSRVNLGVAAAVAEQLVPEAGWIGPRGRERLARRQRFNEAARLQPMGADGRLPDREQDVPSLLQIQRFVTWATQVTVSPHSEVVTVGRTDGNRSTVATPTPAHLQGAPPWPSTHPPDCRVATRTSASPEPLR